MVCFDSVGRRSSTRVGPCPRGSREYSSVTRCSLTKERSSILSQTVGPMLMIMSSYEAILRGKFGFAGGLSRISYR